MACQHSNPVGYLFCSSCGQPLEHQRCLCGFVCAADALYCGRCGHSLNFNDDIDEAVPPVSAVEHRYDLDMLVQLAGVNHKKPKFDDIKAVKIDPKDVRQMWFAMKKNGAKL